MAENLNIDIRAFDRTKNAFNSVARGLGVIKNKIGSVQGALAALGGGAALVGMAKSIDDIAKQSSRLNITVGELQSLQFAASQTGTGAEELKKGFERFNKAMSEASTGMGTGMRAFDALGVKVTNADGTLRSADDVLNEVADGLSNTTAPADRLRIAMDLFGRSGAGMVNMLQGGSAQLKATRAEFEKLTLTLTDEQASATEEANDQFDRLGRTFLSIGHQITATLMPMLANLATFFSQVMLRSIAYSIDAFRNFVNVFIDGYNFLAEKLPFLEKIQNATFGTGMANNLRTIADNYNQVGQAVGGTGDAIENTTEGFKRQESALQKAIQSFKDYADAAKEVEANMAKAAMNGVKRLEDSLLDVISGAKSAKEAFKDMARSIISDLIRIMIQRSITGPLANALGGFFSPTGAKAIGGPVQRGAPYLVGERGPEMFLPAASGAIVPTKDLAAAGAGVTINQTINVSTGVQQTVRAEISSMLPQIAEMSKSAVMDARRRGGSFAGAFGA